MFKNINKIYMCHNNRFIYLLFDISFFLYLIAYYVYYHDNYGHEFRLVATISVFFWGILLSLKRWQKINSYMIWYFSFIVLGFLSMLWARDTQQITSISVTLIRNLLIAFFLLKRIKTNQDIYIVLIEYLATILYLDLFVGNSMLNFYTLQEITTVRFGDNFEYNSNTIAMSNVIAIMILIHTFESKKYLKYILGSFYLLIIVLTQSKKGFLGLLIGILIMYFLKKGNVEQKIKRILYAFIVLLFSMVAIYYVPKLYNMIGYRIDGMMNFIITQNNVDMSTLNRVLLIQYALELWGENPIFGVGLNNFSAFQSIGDEGYYAHNNYVELLADLGIIGFLLYYYMPLRLIIQASRDSNNIKILLKCVVIIILFFDFGAVTYQDFRVLLFYILFYSSFFAYDIREKEVKP